MSLDTGSRAPLRSAGLTLASVLATLTVVLSGCGKGGLGGRPGTTASTGAPGAHGALAVTTRNTTRLGGSDPVEDAAAVALTVYPGLTAATRPQAVVLVDEDDWPAALTASTLTGGPLHAPLLYTGRHELPATSSAALASMRPMGAAAVEGAQAIELGTAAAPSGYRNRALRASDPATLAVSIEQLSGALRKRSPSRVIVTALDAAPAMTMPAAGLAAESGTPILLVERSRLPAATAAELRRLGRPAMYVVGPTGVVGDRVVSELRRFGKVTRIDGGAEPAANAVAVARFDDGSFGWGVVEPGHGMVFASSRRALDGPASAVLSATGDYGPLLLLESAERLPRSLTSYLGDLQPGTPPSGPVHGVYNHGWLIGDESAISATVQAQLDSLLQIAPREAPEPEPGV